MNNNKISKIISGTVLLSMMSYTIPVFGYTKDETVYSKLDASGNNYKTIVSTHIQNTENEDLIKDLSDLLNVKNTSGDETFTQDGNTFTWNSNKNDIYYQGESSKELPIQCNVKYELDGKEISKEEIAGKSGNIKITLQYTNKEERTVDINGKKVKMYVPFVVVAGTIVNNDNNKNITVSNGKIVDDGTKTIIAGMAMPGLQESLGLSDNDVEIPNKIEITMDATDFELNSIVSYVTPKVLEDEDLDIFEKLDEVYAKVATLQNSSKQIEEGANTLKDGATTYSEKSQEFNSAMNQVSTGVSNVNSNYTQIDNGISTLKQGTSSVNSGAEQLNSGINELSSQLTSLPESVSALYNGSTQVLDGLNTNKNTGKVGLVDGVNSVISSLQTTTEGLEEALEKSVTGSENTILALKANNTALESALTVLKNDEITNAEAIKNLNTQIAVNNATIKKYEEAKKEANTKKTYVQQQAKQSETSLKSIKTGMTTIQSAVAQINGGLAKLNTASEKLPSALTKLSEGSKTLSNGTKTLSSGAQTLSKGSTALKTGIQTLDTSTKTLATANGQLTEGANSLAEGATTLADGIKTFNEEGIQKICNYINGDAKNLSTRIEKLTELPKEYKNFTMLNEGNEGNVKFIMIIDAIKKQEASEQNKEEAILDTNIMSEEE